MKMVQYDDIPIHYIGQTILEIGVNEKRLLQSKLAPKIKEANYLGIDIKLRTKPKLETIEADIIDYKINGTYDTILAIEILEHIPFCHWNSLINKLKQALNENGSLIISTPYKQKLEDYIYSVPNDPYQIHTIFGVNKKIMKYYFPNCKIKIISTFWWRQDNTNLIYASLRFLKRLLFGISPIKRNIMVFWQKS